MKRITKTVLSIAMFLVAAIAKGQDDVTLTVFGEGVSKEIATTNALRSAIEQAYGVFVSANTSILNDQLVKDEIATISTGNIKSYKEVSLVHTVEGNYNITVSAVVSIQNLIKYSQSHGSSAEFAGQTFSYNMRMRELNKRNEMTALNNMVEQLQCLEGEIFDYIVDVKEPQYLDSKNYFVPVTVAVTTNQNYEHFQQIISNTLDALSLTEDEVIAYNTNNMKVTAFVPYFFKEFIKDYELNIYSKRGDSHYWKNRFAGKIFFYLRNSYADIDKINSRICDIIENSQRSYYIKAQDARDYDDMPPKVEWIPSKEDILPISSDYMDFGDSKIIITQTYDRTLNKRCGFRQKGVGEVFATITHSFQYDLESINYLKGFVAIKKSVDELLVRRWEELLRPFRVGLRSPSESEFKLYSNYYCLNGYKYCSEWKDLDSEIIFDVKSLSIKFSSLPDVIFTIDHYLDEHDAARGDLFWEEIEDGDWKGYKRIKLNCKEASVEGFNCYPILELRTNGPKRFIFLEFDRSYLYDLEFWVMKWSERRSDNHSAITPLIEQ